MSRELRRWQSECVKKLIEKFNGKQGNHFFCLAATATGKTFMAAEAAKRLLDSDSIDIVLCFCPSNEIQFSMRKTFKAHLGKAFDDSHQSIGSVHTYQGMLHQSKEFWDILSDYRVFVVFDEIHHCAGTAFSKSNSWGTQILNLIVEKAAYILCLSGTPWRSDNLPITTAIYDHDNQIQCDYTYGLADAVRDDVCRKPNVLLVDNNHIHVKAGSKDERVFESISHALKESPLRYAQILRDLTAQRFMLKKAVRKLEKISRQNPCAAGLVVASSVDHAEQLAEMLRHEFKQRAVVVSYLHPKAPETIEHFRNGLTQWIVSVGMVSEGTDIPRLQVCCHLSHVRTEVHFRQTLGRILRLTDSENQEAWLYALAEPSLCEFAKRLQINIPEMTVNFESMQESDDDESFETIPNDSVKPSEDLPNDLFFSFGENKDESDRANTEADSDQSTKDHEENGETNSDLKIYNFELNANYFIEQLVELYDDEAINNE